MVVYSLLACSFDIVYSYFNSTVDVAQLRTASFLFEMIVIGDGMDKLLSNSILSYSELCDNITYVCTR